MRQNDLGPLSYPRRKPKRVGRGNGSGHGTYSGRGLKGQKARAGNNKMRPGFEGGQLPLIKRLPEKRGFYNPFRVEYSVVNVDQLGFFEEQSEITLYHLYQAGLVGSTRRPVKILGEGSISRPLVVKAHKFSATAREKIEAVGGRAVEVAFATETD